MAGMPANSSAHYLTCHQLLTPYACREPNGNGKATLAAAAAAAAQLNCLALSVQIPCFAWLHAQIKSVQINLEFIILLLLECTFINSKITYFHYILLSSVFLGVFLEFRFSCFPTSPQKA